jgi:hypothetical protein
MALVINGVSTGLAGTEPSLSLALFLRQHVGDKVIYESNIAGFRRLQTSKGGLRPLPSPPTQSQCRC